MKKLLAATAAILLSGAAWLLADFAVTCEYNYTANGVQIANNNVFTTPIGTDSTNLITVVVTVGTNDLQFSLALIPTNCYLAIRNLAAVTTSNWIKFGATVSNYPNMLWPGQSMVVGWNATNLNISCRTNTTTARIVAVPQQ